MTVSKNVNIRWFITLSWQDSSCHWWCKHVAAPVWPYIVFQQKLQSHCDISLTQHDLAALIFHTCDSLYFPPFALLDSYWGKSCENRNRKITKHPVRLPCTCMCSVSYSVLSSLLLWESHPHSAVIGPGDQLKQINIEILKVTVILSSKTEQSLRDTMKYFFLMQGNLLYK